MVNSKKVERISIGFDIETAKKLHKDAEESGQYLAEYVRDLIWNNGSKRRRPKSLAPTYRKRKEPLK